MSIFPRRLTRGENCIIHLKFTNSNKTLKKIHYNLKILDPDGIEIENILDNFILGISKDEFKKEFYYCFKTKQNTKLGKYRVSLGFYYNGVLLKSQTSNFDYFVVEDVKVDVINDKEYYLTNMSKENTIIDFIKIKNNKNFYSNYELKGLEKCKFKIDADKIFIKYGNNFIKEINEDLYKIYERKKELFWKNLDNKILIYNDISKKKTILENNESIVWNFLDGINTNLDISKSTKIDINQIETILKKLESEHLIKKV